MKLYYIGIIRPSEEQGSDVELVAVKDLSSFNRYKKGSVAEFMTFFSKQVAHGVKAGQRVDIEEQSYVVHSYTRSEGVSGVIISDQDYPAMAAHQLLSKVLDEFLAKNPRSAFQMAGANSIEFKELDEYIVTYQKPEEASAIMKVQRELDETKIVLHKTIEKLLERDEKLDNLVARSNDLSFQSRMFYGQAKKQNSCCVVM